MLLCRPLRANNHAKAMQPLALLNLIEQQNLRI
jgi:hypothetical protein